MIRPLKTFTFAVFLLGCPIPRWADGALAGETPEELRGRATGPDLIVADLQALKRWGRVGDITAYSVGTTVCNLGDNRASWVLNTNQHPIVPQHMYRLKDGRFEQIGMSWVTHTYFPLNGTFCSENCVPGGTSALGPLCSDVHSSSVNGLQANMAPRSQVNAATGVFPYPWTSPPYPATIGRRLQVHDADLYPPSNPGALYFVEGQYLTRDETVAGNHYNNASYRRVQVVWYEGSPTVYELAFVMGYETQREKPALLAWQDFDPAVTVTYLDIPSDGRMMLAYKVSDLGGGWYHYEYAVCNMNSHRSAQSFSIPIPMGVSVVNIGFHDVDYHSGEPYDLSDWTATPPGDSVTWATTPYSVNPDANALRWGTTYNFRFDADVPPGIADATLVLFRPGTPTSITLPTHGPVPLTGADCNTNGVDDALDIFHGTSQDCNRTGTPDECEIAAGTSLDCTANGTPDECEADCNANGAADTCDILVGTSQDCTGNGTPDECERDCNLNGIADSCDLLQGTSHDCDTNGLPDDCDLALGTARDCNNNGFPDECDLHGGTSRDCNGNKVPDECDIYAGTSSDCNQNTIPDACDLAAGTSADCNNNTFPDECEALTDCNSNSVPDICDIGVGTSVDCNYNNIPDECESAADCNTNGLHDICDIYAGTSRDCNHNGIPDDCDMRSGTSTDCNHNATPDDCESVADCNTNGIPDLCDFYAGTSFDCNGNVVPDECDIAVGTSQDLNRNSIPDECDNPVPAVSPWGLGLLTLLFIVAGAAVFHRRPPVFASARDPRRR